MRNIGEYQKQIWKFVNELCHIYYRNSQPEDREDIRNEVTLRAEVNLHKVEDKAENEFLGWLHGIAKNVIRNWSRREGRIAKYSEGSLDDKNLTQQLVQNINSDASSPETQVLEEERTRIIQEAISELSLIHQQVIWLFYIRELSEKKITARLGISKGTVKSRLHHARKRLAEVLEPYILGN